MIEYLIHAGSVAGVFVIAGSGIYILSRLCGQVTFVSAVYMALAGSICSYLSRSNLESTGIIEGRNFSFLISFMIAVAITSVISALFGLITYKMRHSQALLISIAVSSVIIYLLERLTFLVGKNGFINASQDMDVGGNNFTNLGIGNHTFSREVGIFILVILLASITIFYTRNICRSPFSRSMRSLASGEKFAEICAISTLRTILGAHVLSGIFFGVAGALTPFVFGSFEISSVSLWAGTFGLLLSAQLLILVNVSIFRNYWINCLVIAVLAGGATLLAQNSDYIDGLVNDSGARITSLQVATMVGSLFLILGMHVHSRLLKHES